MTVYRCNLCVGFLAVSLRVLLNHLGRNHQNDTNFHLLCGINGCARTYSSYFSFRNHVVSKHADLFDNESHTDTVPGPTSNRREGQQRREPENADLVEDAQHDADDAFDWETEQQQMLRSSSSCILQFKDEGRIPQTVVDCFVKKTTHIVQNSIDIAKRGVKDSLKTAGLDFNAIPGLSELFNEDSFLANPFHGLEKEPQQFKYYKENFGLVEPQEVVLGEYHTKVRKRNRMVNKVKKDCCYYIPLLRSLQQLLNDATILEEVMNPHASDDGLLYDFCDGESFKAHPLFSTDKFALQLLLYYDELEVCNPLGSRANKHKLGAFYYALGNIRPEKRSSVNAIQLLALATSKHIKQYGIEPVLECFLQDLSELEKDAGHKFSINGALVTFRGTIGFFSGDNLGSQLIGGFKEGSRSHRPCRECMATRTEITAHFHESKFVLRTQNSYDVQCQRLAQGGHFGKTYGLNKQSCLTQSRYFRVIGGLPPDAMHDILEGVLQYCVKLALKVFVLEKKFLTIEELNRRIVTFDYGYQNDTNKPSAILRTKLASDEKSLKQHANQIWCLATHLPLLIGTLVPEDDEHWELMCCLLEIIRIIFSPQISKDQMPYLQFKIQYHQEKFKVLYPDWSIIPKMHYMVHMPRVILQKGPLVRSWCMRYESKHHYFKHLSVMIGNYINLPFSLAKRHQEGLCCRIQASGGSLTSLIEKGIVVGPGSTSHVGTVDQSEVLLGEDPEMDHLTPVFQAKWVTICGTKYKVGAVLHIGYDNNDFPKFWEIIQIYVVDRNITNMKFIVAEKLTLEFNVHFQSYEVTSLPIQHIKVVYHRDFTYFRPLNLTKPIGLRTRMKYVCMRVELGTCM